MIIITTFHFCHNLSFSSHEFRVMKISAKSGLNVPDLLPNIIDRIPAPTGDVKGELRLRLVDSWFDVYRGVVLLVQVCTA
jgi:translation elongation factor EF-4